MTKINLRGLDLGQLETFFKDLGEPRYRARQTYRRLHRHRAREIGELRELSQSLRDRVGELAVLPGAEILHRAEGADGTEKFIFDVSGSREARLRVEAVWIVGEKRRTICISCQVGCSLDCSFCATGTLSFEGNLETWQILEQVYGVEEARGERATNVVFMGMGEPFHNYDNVLAAAHTLTDQHGSGLGVRRVTISTAGIVPGIDRFTQERQPFKLAVSLNHSENEGRSEIMSINRRFPLAELLESVRRYTGSSGHRATFEYVMIAGVNMEPEHLRRLVSIGRSMPCKINLIPLNTDLRGLRRPSSAEAESFRLGLVEAGIAAFNRGSPGQEVGGACGMLALQEDMPSVDSAPS